MEERGLVGIEARGADGGELGRISEVVTDEESGEVTHVMVERGGESVEVPIARIVLDPEADFATVSADPSDDAPRDLLDEEVAPEGYAPADSGVDDQRHERQLVSEPNDPSDAKPPEDLDRESGEADGWQDEESTPADSGYPRTDAYIDPDTGEATESYPDAADAPSLEEAVDAVLEDTTLQAGSISEGVVTLLGNAPDNAELDRVAARITALEEVFEVDATRVKVG